MNIISNGELSDPLCDSVNKGLTLVRLDTMYQEFEFFISENQFFDIKNSEFFCDIRKKIYIKNANLLNKKINFIEFDFF